MSIHFDGLFDCSKGSCNRQSLKTLVRSQAVVHSTVFKRTNRIDVKEEGGRGSALNVSLTLSVINIDFPTAPKKKVFQAPPL